MKIGSFSLIKELNTSLILNTIKEKKSISRADIAKLTGLTAATVTNITSELLKYNLIEETEFGTSSGGRKPILLEFNHSYYNVVGVVISKEEIMVSLTDLNSNLITKVIVETKKDLSPEEVLDKISDTTLSVIKSSSKKVLGVGISMEGLVDERNGVCVLSSSFGWKNISIADYISKKLSLPVFVNNDVKAMAKGEEMFGEGKEFSNFVLLYTGYGIGASLVYNGEIYRGASNYACEIGHITIDINGPKCSCGNRGCFQSLASGEALIKEIKSNNKEITVSDIIARIKENDKEILVQLDKQAHYIGVGIANIINIFNPSKIIITGYISLAPEYIKDIILKEANERSLSNMRNDTKIIFSNMGTENKYKGAVGLFISELFDNPEIFF